LQAELPDFYATLGLHPKATTAEIRAAYRFCAKQSHPDVNATAEEARMQQLNAAYETLGDSSRRRAYDHERKSAHSSRPAGPRQRSISQDAWLRIEDFLRGTTLDVTVKDPANPGPTENYRVTVPPMTAPGAKFRCAREAPFEGGFVEIRVRALPGFRFKVSGSNLRLDLRISAERAAKGGNETITELTGGLRTIRIPARVPRGEILRLAGEGLPKSRGGRGDLLVRVIYRPEVRVSRAR
jgi:DnaJ-class molecular chaperone